ncbi:MAG: hypothetical protein R3261_04760 [Alphaproteobacteria bacterium]|nr:hypothetical protein [Alphaproteobacteria bacterium]
MSREEIEKKIEQMLEEVYQARIGMTRGEVPDLHDVPVTLGQLTADVMGLADADSVALKGKLGELRDDLETLSWEMGEIARRLRDGDDVVEDAEDEQSQSASK